MARRRRQYRDPRSGRYAVRRIRRRVTARRSAPIGPVSPVISGSRVVGYRDTRTGRLVPPRIGQFRVNIQAITGAGGVSSYRDLNTGRFLNPQAGAQLSVRPSVRAVQGVAVEAERFVAALAAFHDLVGGNVDRLVTAHALDYQMRVQMRTPVRTGRLRNSIHTVPPNSSDSFSYRDGTGRSYSGSLGVRTGPGEAVVGTNVEYAAAVEAGWSRQAPAGMFAVTLKEKTTDLEREIEAATVRLWNSLG